MLFMKWKFYRDGANFVDKLGSITEMRVFQEIVYRCNKNTLVWSHSKEERVKICEKLKISELTFKRTLQALTNSRLIIWKSRGNYIVNNDYVDFGSENKS